MKSKLTFAIFVTIQLLLAACRPNSLQWSFIPLPSEESLPLMSFITVGNQLWISNASSGVLVQSNLMSDGQHQDWDEIPIPTDIQIWRMCASSDFVWIISYFESLLSQATPPVYRYNPYDGKWKEMDFPELSGIPECKSLGDGTVLLYDANDIYVVDDDTISHFTVELVTIWDVSKDGNNSLWILGADGIVYKQVTAYEWEVWINVQDGVKLFNTEEYLWVVRANDLYQYTDNYISPGYLAFHFGDGESIINVYQLEKVIVLVTSDSIYIGDHESFSNYPLPRSTNRIIAAALDFNNFVLYILTDSGIYRLVNLP